MIKELLKTVVSFGFLGRKLTEEYLINLVTKSSYKESIEVDLSKKEYRKLPIYFWLSIFLIITIAINSVIWTFFLGKYALLAFMFAFSLSVILSIYFLVKVFNEMLSKSIVIVDNSRFNNNKYDKKIQSLIQQKGDFTNE